MLFLEKGYTATSIDQICEKVGVTKGGFFHHFASKEVFAAAMLEYTWTDFEERHAAMDVTRDPGGALAEHVDFMVRYIADTGRLLPLLAGELGSTHPEIRQQVRGYFQSWMTFLVDALTTVRTQSGADFDPQAVKEFIISTIEGVPVSASQFGPQAVENTAHHLKAYLAHLVAGPRVRGPRSQHTDQSV